MAKKVLNVHIEAVVYLKDTNDDYVLDTDGEKIILKSGLEVNATDDYEFLITKTEF
jgi:hypothetical protein